MNLNLVRLSQSLPLALISPLGLTREVSTVCKNATPVGSIVRFAKSNTFGKLKSFAMKRCACALGVRYRQRRRSRRRGGEVRGFSNGSFQVGCFRKSWW